MTMLTDLNRICLNYGEARTIEDHLAADGRCHWFGGCFNKAKTTRRGPIGGGAFGQVPICARCDARVEALER